MSFTFTTQTANTASYYLNKHNTLLAESLQRLASGNRLIHSGVDPGGLAVASKLNANISRIGAAKTNVASGVSLLQTQDAALESASDILTRMVALKSSHDGALTSSDQAAYNTEFQQLRQQLHAFTNGTFNGISLFAGSNSATFGQTVLPANQLSIYTSEEGAAGGSIDLEKAAFVSALNVRGTSQAGTMVDTSYNVEENLASATVDSNGNASLGAFGSGDLYNAISNIGSLRAVNGGSQNALGFASTLLAKKSTALTGAVDNITSVDIAAETATQTSLNILIQSATAAVAQANIQASTTLTLLGSLTRF
jgi:flagellin